MDRPVQGAADQWIERAAAACGLPPRGIESLRPGLERFLVAYAQSRTPTAAGRAGAAQCILDTLGARFRIEGWIARHPQVLERPVERPVFILGLPRAGTTLLVNLLARDPQHRFYWSWEANREIPPAHQAHMHDDPRIARKVAEIDAALAQGLLDHRQHVESGDQPAECIMLLGQDIKSYLWLAQAQMPGYFDWLLDAADMVAAYRHHRRALHVMQSEAPGQWMLKLPSHAFAIDAILQVYPDARIVVTHRDPLKAAASSCDAEHFFLALGNDGLDLHAIGDQTVRFLSTGMQRVTAARATHPDVAWHDMHFSDIAADPIAEVRRLYDFLGQVLTPETEDAMRAELAATLRLRAQLGPHRYRAETYGLSRATVMPWFEDYVARYGVKLEPDG